MKNSLAVLLAIVLSTIGYAMAQGVPVTEFSGATADVQLNACIAALSGGGICDARGYGNSLQSIAATVTVGAGQMILFNPATKFQPASSSITMFSLTAGATVRGGWFDVSNQPSFSGRAVAFTGNYWDVFSVGTQGMHTVLSNVKITGVNGGSPIITGDAIYLGATASNAIAYLSIYDVNVEGFANCIHLQASGNAWINGNMFANVGCSYSVIGVNLDNSGTNTIEGNQFVNLNIQYGSGVTTSGIQSTNTGIVRYNQFVNTDVWDTTSVPPINFTSANTYTNYVQGRFDGTPVNTPYNQNNIVNLHTSGVGPLSAQNYTASAPTSGSAVTVYTFPSGMLATYLISASLTATTNSPSNYAAWAIIALDGTASSILTQNNGTLLSLSLSGLNLQATQSSGAAKTIEISLTRLR